MLWCYEGMFQDDWPHGQGSVMMSTTSKMYHGEFNKGSFHGLGKLTIQDRLLYAGNWLDGSPNGHGKCSYEKNKVTYDGNWSKGMWHSDGKITLKGKSYTI